MTSNTTDERRKTKSRPTVRDDAATRGMNNEWRISNIGRLLNGAVHRFEASILDKMAAAGHSECTLSHINVTRNLDIEGTRAVELARRASMTKQSLGELITQLEALGIVKREQDPTDGRAKVVLFTEAGRNWLEQFHTALEQTEAELESELGPALYKALKRGLQKYAHGTERTSDRR